MKIHDEHYGYLGNREIEDILEERICLDTSKHKDYGIVEERRMHEKEDDVVNTNEEEIKRRDETR